MAYQTALRRERIDTIELIIEKCSKASLPATKHGLFDFATDKWGISYRKLTEYLTDLVMRKIIVTDKDDCWTLRRWRLIMAAREKDYNKMRDIISKI